MNTPHITLGIETSCDETSAGIIKDGKYVLSNIVSSQIKQHQKYGGVVPEMASRLHVQNITKVIMHALSASQLTWSDLHLISATQGPGLLGALSIGFLAGKTLAYTLGIPFIGVNHIEGHFYANLLDQEETIEYPLLILVASGGHTQLLLSNEPFHYQLIGNTLDDAIGEAFDKSARMLGRGYPGGPIIDHLAKKGSRRVFHFPQVKTKTAFDFSFSGLKTAVLHQVTNQNLHLEEKESQKLCDFCASLQNRLINELMDKTIHAAQTFRVRQIIIAGGVTANSYLREALLTHANEFKITLPRLDYCTDNGAMIAAAGFARFMAGCKTPLSAEPLSRFPLAQLTDIYTQT